jgi:hypothetical protein
MQLTARAFGTAQHVAPERLGGVRESMRRVIFPIIAGLWGYPVAADAYSLRTGDGLLSVCTDQHEDMKAYCRGYIDAVVEYLVIERLGQKHPFCIPNDVPHSNNRKRCD